MEKTKKNKNIALVLSSGGAKGYAHIGVIKVLEKNGYNITSIAGTSMGSLVGGMYASGKLEDFEKWVLSLTKREVLRLTDFSISKRGIIKGKKVFEEIKKILPNYKIEELKIPYCAVATNILDGTEIVFENGYLYDAIRSSVSIPILFHPHLINNMCLIDGGLVNPIPINRVKRKDNDMIVAVDVNVKNDETIESCQLSNKKLNILIPDKRFVGVINLAEKSVGVVIRKISEYSLEKNKPDILIKVPLSNYSTYDFYRGKEIIAEGEKAAKEIFESQ